MRNIILFVAIIIVGFEGQIFAQINLDSNISVRFSIQSFGYGKVKGRFYSVNGTANFDKENINESSFDFQIETNSVETGRELINDFVSNEDFFSVEKYPVISFKSKGFSKSENQCQMTGDLTIKGITKLISIPFEMNEKNGEIILKTTLELNRFDFDLGKKYGQFWIKETVTTELEAVFKNSEKGEITSLCLAK